MTSDRLTLDQADLGWVLAGDGAARFRLVNEYLAYLVDRNYSPRTVRTYGIGLLAFCRWLTVEGIDLSAVTTDGMLRFLTACRTEHVAGRAGPNVVRMDGTRLDGLSPATINLRLAAVSGLFTFRAMRDPSMSSPIPRGREARHRSAGERGGMLTHVDRGVRQRSALRVRDARRLPRGLDNTQVVALLESLRSWRDRAVAGLMVFCGLRSAEVLDLDVGDVDIGGRWLLVNGKGAKERRVPLDVDVAGVIQTYLLAERPETTSCRLFIVAKGPTRGQPLTLAGLRRVFRYTVNFPGSRAVTRTRCATRSLSALQHGCEGRAFRGLRRTCLRSIRSWDSVTTDSSTLRMNQTKTTPIPISISWLCPTLPFPR